MVFLSVNQKEKKLNEALRIFLLPSPGDTTEQSRFPLWTEKLPAPDRIKKDTTALFRRLSPRKSERVPPFPRKLFLLPS